MSPASSYEVFEELGRGQNTVVYRGYDLTLGREVAIKELNQAQRANPTRLTALLQEAKFLAQAEHDNVLRVYSVNQELGWIVMERMRATLASLIASGPSDPDLARSVLRQMLAALQFLHSRKKVHGGIRPTNLLINDQGRVKLSDFEQVDVGGELRLPTATKKYLAPELIRPALGSFGPPTDLYSLGFTTLELLAGPDFDSLVPGIKGAINADLAWLRWHSSPQPLPSVALLLARVPGDLVSTLDKMLAKEVNDRPATAAEALALLDDKPLVSIRLAEQPPASASAESFERTVMRTVARGSGDGDPTGKLPASAIKSSDSSSPRVRRATGRSDAVPLPRYSAAWWNQQLGKPYILYPVCALILAGFAAASLALRAGGASQSAGRQQQGDLATAPERQEIDSPPVAEPATPVIAAVPPTPEVDPPRPAEPPRRVVISVTPADARVFVAGKRQPSEAGKTEISLEADAPLRLRVDKLRFAKFAKVFSPAELQRTHNHLEVRLEKLPASLPPALVPAPDSQVEPASGLPLSALASKLPEDAPLRFALIPPGTYRCGAGDQDRQPGELPLSTFDVTQPFYMAVHETSIQQFNLFAAEQPMGDSWKRTAQRWIGTSGQLSQSRLPATGMTAGQAEQFAAWLGGRLPTEQEWEAAARGLDDAGHPFPWGRGALAPARCRSFRGQLAPLPVDQLPQGATPQGIQNLLGNAAEWCRADTSGTHPHLVKGCSFATANQDIIRTSWRGKASQAGDQDVGFRVVVAVDRNEASPATFPVRTLGTTALSWLLP